jgi:hypothetical protein
MISEWSKQASVISYRLTVVGKWSIQPRKRLYLMRQAPKIEYLRTRIQPMAQVVLSLGEQGKQSARQSWILPGRAGREEIL